MRIRTASRVVVCASAVAVALVGLAGTASAGEITGNGTLKPVNGASECAYSGQNDGFHIPELADDEFDALQRVQTYGKIHKFIPVKGLPGYACNPAGKRP